MKIITKYQLAITDSQVIRVPENAELIDLIENNGMPAILFVVHSHAERSTKKKMKFRQCEYLWPSGCEYIGSYYTPSKILMHVFLESEHG